MTHKTLEHDLKHQYTIVLLTFTHLDRANLQNVRKNFGDGGKICPEQLYYAPYFRVEFYKNPQVEHC